MSSNSKICPQCQLTNAAQNLVCLRCETSLIYVDFAPNLTEKYGSRSADRHYFLEELFNPTFLVCIPLGVTCVVLAILSFGTPLTAVFFPLAVILISLPFFPGDPVGAALRRRLEQFQAKLQPSSTETANWPVLSHASTETENEPSLAERSEP